MAIPENPHTALIGSVLLERFGLPQNSLTVTEIPQAKNNHVYLIELASPVSEPLTDVAPKPLTCAIPADTAKLVFRISKVNVSLEDSVRVRNEVAFLHLARNALSSVNESLIPRVFSWEDDAGQVSESEPKSANRWILEEWKAGETLNVDKLGALDNETQKLVLEQIASITKAFQEYQLPETARGFGGLTFNDEGIISNTASSIPCGGPFPTYAEFLKGMCKWQLEASERSTHLNGWKDVPKLRKRLDALFEGGLDEILARVPEQKPTLVHADLCFPNLLFDASTYRLTAVLDFDFSHIGAPVSEYLFSFWDLDGILPGTAQPMGLVRKWLLKGFPKKTDSQFRLLRLWDDVCGETGAAKPSNIDEAAHIADVWWFSQELCQAYWHMEKFIANKEASSLEKMKQGSVRNLEKYLTLWGF